MLTGFAASRLAARNLPRQLAAVYAVFTNCAAIAGAADSIQSY
jgi:hypothetical protein